MWGAGQRDFRAGIACWDSVLPEPALYQGLHGAGEGTKGSRSANGARVWKLEKQRVRAVIYAADGRVVRHLLDRTLFPGEARVTWDGRTNGGEAAACGVFYCRVTGERGHARVRLVRVR